MRTNASRVPAGRRAATSSRNVLAVWLGVGLLVGGCAIGANGGYGAGYNYSDLDSPQRQCQRNNGVWRPQIANGYCEMSK